MGGCRCTFRNCTVKSDGKTHLFHYPVFEKVRCQKWLLNGDRFDLLELTVSQLKNRVVCQHHFREDNFMNYKCDKLRHDAVPTEPGPYCNPFKYKPKLTTREIYNAILLADFDKDEPQAKSEIDKKAIFQVKYLDYLTNNDLLTELNYYNNNIIDIDTDINEAKNDVNIDKSHNKTYLIEKEAAVEKPVSFVQVSNTFEDNNKDVQLTITNLERPVKNVIKGEPKINIISEEISHNPIPLVGPIYSLQPISPSFILRLPNKQNSETKDLRNDMPVKNNKEEQIVEKLNTSHQGTISENQSLQVNLSQVNKNIGKVKPQKLSEISGDKVIIEQPSNISKGKLQSPKISHISEENLKPAKPLDISNYSKEPSTSLILKNQITPERVAAIQEKRNFNMKLKDILEESLSRLEEKDNENDLQKLINNARNKQVIQFKSGNKTGSKVSNIRGFQKYTKYLEARIKTMEKTLLDRIGQNTQELAKLKNTIVVDNSSRRFSTATQTKFNDESYKKYLYQEISQFLTPGSNSLIYEELFLNKHVKVNNTMLTSSSHKRRKYR